MPDSAAANADPLWDDLGIPVDLDRSGKQPAKTNGAAAPVSGDRTVNVQMSTEMVPLLTPEAAASLNAQIAAKAEADTALSAREVQARAMQDVGPDSAAAVTCELGNEIHRLELKKIALTSDVEDLEREIEKLKATKLDAEKSTSTGRRERAYRAAGCNRGAGLLGQTHRFVREPARRCCLQQR